MLSKVRSNINSKSQELPYWPVWVCLAAVVAGQLVLIVPALLFTIFGLPKETLATLFGFTATLGCVLFFGSLLKEGISSKRLGLNRTSIRIAFGLTLSVFVISTAVELAAFNLAGGTQDPFVFALDLGGIETIAILVIFAPIVEEVFFRGVLFPALSRKLGVIAGAVLSSGLFGLIHLPNTSLVGVLAFAFSGLLYTFLYRKTGSIIPGILLHGYGNAVLASTLIGVSGLLVYVTALAIIPTLLLITLPFTKINKSFKLRGRNHHQPTLNTFESATAA